MPIDAILPTLMLPELSSVLTTGRPYQVGELEEHPTDEFRLWAWQQGTGKTWEAIARAVLLFERGLIDACLVMAPKGVHYNWVDIELPKHCGLPYLAHAVDNDKDTSGHKQHASDLLAVLTPGGPRRLKVLAVGWPTLIKDTMVKLTPVRNASPKVTGRLADFCRSHKVLIIGDELRKIKDPEGLISQRAVALAGLCPFRLGLDGTPVDNGAIDLYAEMMFLDSRFWVKRGIGSISAWQGRFCKLAPVSRRPLENADGSPRMRWNPETRKREPAMPMRIESYKNLDQLREMLAPHMSRVTKKSAGLNLPPKSYVTLPFDLTPTQRKVYDRMAKEYHVFLEGNLFTAEMALVRQTRLMQIASGYLPLDDKGEELAEIDPGRDPRLESLIAWAEPVTEQAMIWAAYRPDRDKILKALGDRVVCYRSDTSDDQKREAIAAWVRGDFQFILGHVKSGLSSGHTLTNAHLSFFYSNLYFHADRMQAEDRIHRIGQELACTYYDQCARNTIDAKVVLSLISKVGVAAEVLGDEREEWIRPL